MLTCLHAHAYTCLNLAANGPQPVSHLTPCLVVVACDEQLTLRLDDWGVSYMLGRLGEGNKGTRWTLLETGSWVSPGCWYSMSGENRLVLNFNGDAQDGASGSVRKWKEQRKNVDLGHFEERRREVFCSPNIGEERGCVYRLTDHTNGRLCVVHDHDGCCLVGDGGADLGGGG